MKPSGPSLVALLLAAASLLAQDAGADDAVPKAPPTGRYEPMALRSPFTAPTTALPVATPPPAPPGPHWWDQMVVTSLMEAGGTYFAAVVDKANNKRYVLETGRPDENTQLLLANVVWNERADQSTVTVSRGAEVAPPLRFDPSTAAPPTNQPAYVENPQGKRQSVPQLPPNLNGAPPPPPPPTSVVRRTAPIASQPAPGTAPSSAPRKIRPLGGER